MERYSYTYLIVKWKLIFVKIFDFYKSMFLKIFSGTKIYARIHFEKKNYFVFVWYKNKNTRTASRKLLFRQSLA